VSTRRCSSSTRSARAHEPSGGQPLLPIRSRSVFAVPPNKAMQTDGRFAAAADRQGVRRLGGRRRRTQGSSDVHQLHTVVHMPMRHRSIRLQH
jgi:hypothetical protein